MMICLLMGSYSLKADEEMGDDQEFMKSLDAVKNPFEDGLPKPVPVVPQAPKVIFPTPVATPTYVAPKFEMPKVVPVIAPVVLPTLHLDGVIVGDDIKQAIINDQVVPLMGTIEDAQVISVEKEGVELSFKGKKFFLKVE